MASRFGTLVPFRFFQIALDLAEPIALARFVALLIVFRDDRILIGFTTRAFADLGIHIVVMFPVHGMYPGR